MTKMTEAELRAKIQRLQTYMEQQDVEEGIWGDLAPTWLGGDPTPPAVAPIKVKKTPRNYAQAQAMVDKLYKAAQVRPEADDVVKSRFGLPTLPPYEQWDGTMPQGKGSDFLTKHLFGRQGSADAEVANAQNQGTAQTTADAEARVDANLEKLKELIDQLKALSTPQTQATTQADGPESLSESIRRTISLLSEKADPTRPASMKNINGMNVFTNDAEPAAPTASKEDLIKQIQDIMQAIVADAGEDPEPEIAQAIQDAQTAIDSAKTPEPTSAPTTDAPAATPASATGEPAKPAVDGAPTAAGKPMTWKDIYDLNKDQIKNPNLIYPNQQLKMPDGSTYTVKPGDNLSSIAKGGTSTAPTPPTPPSPPTPPGAPTAPAAPKPPVAAPKPAVPQVQKELPPEMMNKFSPKLPATGQYQKLNTPTLPGDIPAWGASPINPVNQNTKVLDVKNPEYIAKRAAALQKPGAVIGQTTVQEGQVLSQDPTLARIIQLSR